MVTKHQIKLIKSLSQKKYRIQEGLFIVEGIKGINEFLDSEYELVNLFSTSPDFKVAKEKLILITERELKKLSSLKNPNTVLGVFNIPDFKSPKKNISSVLLDDVRDPGNLGTIIRLCDWFGINQLVCSTNTVDCYNAKVVQATMGSLTRVKVYYADLEEFIKESKIKSLGTFMDGDNIYHTALPTEAHFILGNEANGISKRIEATVHQKISIPQFGEIKATESLNVANATAIVLSEFKRRFIEK